MTKWIHLHKLNAGLLKFFSKCFTTLLPGGRLVLEPQPFSTYSKSAKFSDALKANWDTLRAEGEEKGWRDEDGDFERVLLEMVGFERRERLGCPGKDGESPVLAARPSSRRFDSVADLSSFSWL